MCLFFIKTLFPAITWLGHRLGRRWNGYFSENLLVCHSPNSSWNCHQNSKHQVWIPTSIWSNYVIFFFKKKSSVSFYFRRLDNADSSFRQGGNHDASLSFVMKVKREPAEMDVQHRGLSDPSISFPMLPIAVSPSPDQLLPRKDKTTILSYFFTLLEVTLRSLILSSWHPDLCYHDWPHSSAQDSSSIFSSWYKHWHNDIKCRNRFLELLLI